MSRNWAPIATAPLDSFDELEVRDAEGRECLAWWSPKEGMWRSGGIHQGFPLLPSLDGYPWTEWRHSVVW